MSGQLRILGGALRGRRLQMAPGIRPTGGRVREALFNLWREQIEDSRFLDLFAGTGAVALEAVSRGARQATCVEKDPRVLEVLRKNCRQLAPQTTAAVRGRLPETPQRLPEEAYDLIFADPPYRFTAHEDLLAAARPWLATGGELVIEHSARLTLGPAAGWACQDERRYGESCLTFFRREEPETDA